MEVDSLHPTTKILTTHTYIFHVASGRCSAGGISQLLNYLLCEPEFARVPSYDTIVKYARSPTLGVKPLPWVANSHIGKLRSFTPRQLAAHVLAKIPATSVFSAFRLHRVDCRLVLGDSFQLLRINNTLPAKTKVTKKPAAVADDGDADWAAFARGRGCSKIPPKLTPKPTPKQRDDGASHSQHAHEPDLLDSMLGQLEELKAVLFEVVDDEQPSDDDDPIIDITSDPPLPAMPSSGSGISERERLLGLRADAPRCIAGGSVAEVCSKLQVIEEGWKIFLSEAPATCIGNLKSTFECKTIQAMCLSEDHKAACRCISSRTQCKLLLNIRTSAEATAAELIKWIVAGTAASHEQHVKLGNEMKRNFLARPG